jgi:hypothetical protein
MLIEHIITPRPRKYPENISYSDVTDEYGSEFAMQFMEAQLYAESNSRTILESSNTDTVNYFKKLPSTKPKAGQKYYGMHLALMHESIQSLASFHGTVLKVQRAQSKSTIDSSAIDGVEYTVELDNGETVVYPGILSNNVRMRVLFFDDLRSFNQVKAQLRMSHNVNFKKIQEHVFRDRTGFMLTERYINLIGNDPKKSQYADEVFALLQKAYADIGGIRGNGFNSPEDMVAKIPFWKLVKKDGRIVAAVLYKDKNGRKSVAVGTDGSPEAKRAYQDAIKQEPKRSYSEKSKASLGAFIKHAGNIEQHAQTPEQAEKVLQEPVIPMAGMRPEDWPVDDKERAATLQTIQKYPELERYGYFRDIGGVNSFKVMVGTPNLPIK